MDFSLMTIMEELLSTKSLTVRIQDTNDVRVSYFLMTVRRKNFHSCDSVRIPHTSVDHH